MQKKPSCGKLDKYVLISSLKRRQTARLGQEGVWCLLDSAHPDDFLLSFSAFQLFRKFQIPPPPGSVFFEDEGPVADTVKKCYKLSLALAISLIFAHHLIDFYLVFLFQL